MGSCRARSVYLTTHLLGRFSSLKQLTSIVHILLPETDNCLSWISGRERMTVENISWSSTKECCRLLRGLSLRPPGLQLTAHPTKPPRPLLAVLCSKRVIKKYLALRSTFHCIIGSERVKYFGIFTENTLISKALNLFWFRLIYLKPDTMLHSYVLPEKLHHICRMCPYLGTD